MYVWKNNLFILIGFSGIIMDIQKHFKAEYLVVDTTAFIEHANLQDIGKNIITVQNVVDEITSKRQLRRLIVLPYDLQIKDVFPENVQFVTEFSKKTGDYPSLSATDIKVMALVYQLEKQHLGDKHLNSAPKIRPTVTSGRPTVPTQDPAGFYKGGGDKLNEAPVAETTGEDSCNKPNEELATERVEELHESDSDEVTIDQSNDSEEVNVETLEDKFAELKCDVDLDTSSFDDVLVQVKDDAEKVEGEEEEDDDDDDDDSWITPSNIKQVKNRMDAELVEDRLVTVACITTDFAMQNVLKQIGLNVVALDGRVIKQLRTFILRCYACFKTTSVMTKLFCPNCGHKTLKKVSVSLDENGLQRIHINFSKPISTRGKRFSLPTPKGGKHANNPILVDRQPMPDQRPTRLARTRNNPLDPDYIAGFSPFIMRDVNSKSAMLGIKANQEVKHWMRKNPNEVVKKSRNKKKK